MVAPELQTYFTVKLVSMCLTAEFRKLQAKHRMAENTESILVITLFRLYKKSEQKVRYSHKIFYFPPLGCHLRDGEI